MFTNIAILASQLSETQLIRSYFRNPVRYSVREFLSLADINSGLKSYPFDVLIMHLPSFELRNVAMIKKVRVYFPFAGLITVSPNIDPSVRFELKDIERHRLLLEPMELEDIALIAEKFVRRETSAARLHPRVTRTGDCELVNVERGERIQAKFLDFAQMGTRVLVTPKVPLKRNAKYELHYRSTTEPSRIHRIASNVMWAEISSGMMGTIMHGPEQQVGLRFIAAI